MSASTQFQTYDPGQLRLLPEDMKQWLPEEHLIYFQMDLVDTLDLQEIYAFYDDGSRGGRPVKPPVVWTLSWVYSGGLPGGR